MINEDNRYLPQNIRKRKVLKHFIAFFLMLSAILEAYFFPYLAYAYENLRLTNYGIHYKTETVSIEDSTTSFAEKLTIISDMLQRNSYIYIDSSDVESTSIRARLTHEDAASAGKDAINSAFIAKYAEITGYDSRDISSKIFSTGKYYAQPYLMIKPDTKEMFLIWLVEYIEPSGVIEVFVDDESGKMLSMVSYSDVFSTDIIKPMMLNYNTEMLQGLSTYYELSLEGKLYSSYTMTGKDNYICDIAVESTNNSSVLLQYTEDANSYGEVFFNLGLSGLGYDNSGSNYDYNDYNEYNPTDDLNDYDGGEDE